MTELFENVLLKLGFSQRPAPTLEGLRALYGAWCRHIPFDNVRKLIHVRAGESGPLPGSAARDFFEVWLRHGTGGTCWSGAGAFHALAASLGFAAERGIATMLVYPDLPPNHGSVRVTLEEKHYLVDCSMLHGEPLPLDEHAETRVTHPAWGATCTPRDGRFHVTWRPLNYLQGLVCRFESFGATAAEYEQRYEATRGWSPFNYQVVARGNRGDEVTGVAFGRGVTLHADGSTTDESIGHREAQRRLVELLGMSEEIVSQLPMDVPTPPPPGSRTAMERES